MDATQWIALHEVALVLGDLGDLVLADQRVTADERRGAIGPSHTVLAA